MLHRVKCQSKLACPTLVAVLFVAGVACSAGHDEDETGVRSQALTKDDFPEDAPDELIIDGRLYVREFNLSDDELRELKDPELWKLPTTLDKMAQLVREYIRHPIYGAYVEAEPNYSLARIELGIDPPPLSLRSAVPADTPLPDVIEKKVSTNGDQRAVVAGTTGLSAIGLYEAGGSGVLIGSGRLYTAGHVLYNNPGVSGTDGWECRSGPADPSGVCASAGQSRWSFGGKINNPGPNETWNFVQSQVGCGIEAVKSSWASMPANTQISNRIPLDYGRVRNLENCLGSSVDGLPWWVASQADLRSHSLNAFGYPFLVPCPAGSSGVNSDCPNGTNQLRTNGAVPPITAGSVFVGVPVSDNAVVATAGYIKSNKVDTSTNMSGGPLVAFDDSTWWVVGVVVAGDPNNFAETWYNQLTSGIVTWLYQ